MLAGPTGMSGQLNRRETVLLCTSLLPYIALHCCCTMYPNMYVGQGEGEGQRDRERRSLLSHFKPQHLSARMSDTKDPEPAVLYPKRAIPYLTLFHFYFSSFLYSSYIPLHLILSCLVLSFYNSTPFRLSFPSLLFSSRFYILLI